MEKIKKLKMPFMIGSCLRNHRTSDNGPVLCQKAEQLAKDSDYLEFTATDRWFTRRKKWHGNTFISLKGEAAEADVKAAKTLVTESTPELLKIFPEKNIWNADKTWIHFHALADSTYVLKE